MEEILKLNSIEFPERPDFLPFIIDDIYYDVVTNVNELVESFILRLIAYSDDDTKYINIDKYPLKMEFDEYDKISIHFIARNLKTNKLTGYSRIIPDTNLGLPVDTLIDISDYRIYRLYEMSRMVSYPKRQPNVNRLIRYIAYRWAQADNIQKIVGISLERDKWWFDDKLIVPMIPYRTCRFEDYGTFDPLLKDLKMYGNVFHLDKNEKYISSLFHHSGDK